MIRAFFRKGFRSPPRDMGNNLGGIGWNLLKLGNWGENSPEDLCRFSNLFADFVVLARGLRSGGAVGAWLPWCSALARARPGPFSGRSLGFARGESAPWSPCTKKGKLCICPNSSFSPSAIAFTALPFARLRGKEDPFVSRLAQGSFGGGGLRKF